MTNIIGLPNCGHVLVAREVARVARCRELHGSAVAPRTGADYVAAAMAEYIFELVETGRYCDRTYYNDDRYAEAFAGVERLWGLRLDNADEDTLAARGVVFAFALAADVERAVDDALDAGR